MNTEQLMHYIDILHEEQMYLLRCILTMEVERCKEEKPNILADLQNHLNDTHRQDFKAALAVQKNERYENLSRKLRKDNYEQYFEYDYKKDKP